MESFAQEIRIQLRTRHLTDSQRDLLGSLGVRCVDKKGQNVIHAYVEPAPGQCERGFFVAELSGEELDPPFGCTS